MGEAQSCIKPKNKIRLHPDFSLKSMKDGRLTLNEYQKKCLTTAIYPNDGQVSYLALAICGEAGELADKVKKIIRDKNGNADDTDKKELALELGDVFWYTANLAKVLGFDLSEIVELNIKKIESRVKRGTLHGSGDNGQRYGNLDY